MSFLDMLSSTIHALKQYFATKQELSKKQDKITDEEMTIEMAECDIIQPVASPSGKLFINNEGKIYIF